MLSPADEWSGRQKSLASYAGLVCLIPAYNAAITVPQIVQRALACLPGAEVLVVDDGSTDSTSIVAAAVGARVLTHRRNRGKGAALQSGFDVLLRDDHIERIATVDADLQHRPEDLPLFVEEMDRSNADIVVGHRERWGTRMPLHRILSNTITSALVRARTGIDIPDSQCGLRLIRRRVIEDVRMTAAGFEAETEFLLKSGRKGYRIASVPIQAVYAGEKSHMTHWKTTVEFIRVLFREY
jgi:glycosyltransferase involved in cell wall biosynthesis